MPLDPVLFYGGEISLPAPYPIAIVGLEARAIVGSVCRFNAYCIGMSCIAS